MLKNTGLLFAAIIFGFLFGELGARLSGLEPFSYSPPSKWTLKVLAPDPELGWKNKPGKVEHSFLPENRYMVTTTVASDGSRFSLTSPPTDRWAEFYGGSMGFGWGVTDGKTAADYVARRTGTNVRNYSVGGFGTLQALMVLEKSARKWTSAVKPEFIVYQFATHHWNRASGEPQWLLSNEKNNPRGGRLVGIPYARL